MLTVCVDCPAAIREKRRGENKASMNMVAGQRKEIEEKGGKAEDETVGRTFRVKSDIWFYYWSYT